jgi:hypothetical protein
MITDRSFILAGLATTIALLFTTFLAEPWDIASGVVASLGGAAFLLLFCVARSQQSN